MTRSTRLRRRAMSLSFETDKPWNRTRGSRHDCQVDAPVDRREDPNQSLDRESRDAAATEIGHAWNADGESPRGDMHVGLVGQPEDRVGELTFERRNWVVKHDTMIGPSSGLGGIAPLRIGTPRCSDAGIIAR